MMPNTLCTFEYLTPGVLSSPSLSSSSVSGPAWFRGLGPDKGAEPPSRAFMALFRMLALADASPSSSSSSGSRCSIRTLNCVKPKDKKLMFRQTSFFWGSWSNPTIQHNNCATQRHLNINLSTSVNKTLMRNQTLLDTSYLRQGTVWPHASWFHLLDWHEPCCYGWSRGFAVGGSERCFFCSPPCRTPLLTLLASTSEFYCFKRQKSCEFQRSQDSKRENY